MRHTCITLNHDAGLPRELIRAITGHELDTIDQVLRGSPGVCLTSHDVRQTPLFRSLCGIPTKVIETLASLQRVISDKWRARRDSNS